MDMSSRTSRRRNHDELESDDDDAWGAADGLANDYDSDSPKRPRLDSINGHDDDGTNGEGSNGAGFTDDDYQPGAIVRVSVQNFVTYEKADFLPGPHLNMVIGPNGTGKSSLVCAICLGLGYSPRHLGRAGAVKEFVKYGKDVATIEIELYRRPDDRRNTVIKVQIRRESNTQKWWINGKEASHKAVQQKVSSFKIQVDNLCQFLPQDRVVEFAQCTPVDLLHETLRAAAPAEMLEWHDQLRALHRDKKALNESSESDADHLKNLENRQQGLQVEVDRVRERRETEARVSKLKGAILLAKYNEARDVFIAAKRRRKEAEKDLKKLRNDSGPSLQAIEAKKEYASLVEAVVPGKKEALRIAERESTALAAKVSEASDKAQECGDQIEAEKNGIESKRKELTNCKNKIASLQADLENRPADFDPVEWNQKIRAQEHSRREQETDKRQVEEVLRELKAKGVEARDAMKKVKDDLENFDTDQGQQLHFMKSKFPEVAKGWEWIQENQDQFEKEVFGPPMISCSVKDERYTNQLQSLLQMDDFACFTAQTKNDHRKLTHQLYRVMSLSVSIRTCLNPLESYPTPLSREEAADLGLDGFAIDFLDGPSPVLAMLCSDKRLHMSGVSLQDHSESQYNALVDNGKVTQWAAADQSYNVRRRREYGAGAMTVIAKTIQPGPFWSSQPIDTGAKMELQRQCTILEGEWLELKAENKKAHARLDEIAVEMRAVDEKIDALRQEKSKLQQDYQKWQSLPGKIEAEEATKASREQAIRASREIMAGLQTQWDSAVVERARAAVKHAQSLKKIARAHRALNEVQIQLVEAQSEVDGLKQYSQDIMDKIDEATNTLEEAAQAVADSRQAGDEAGQAVRAIIEHNDELRAELGEICQNKTAEDLQIEVDVAMAQLELLTNTSDKVIEEYERREQDIARLKKKMEGVTTKLEKLDGETAEVMALWEPRLDDLVSQINDAFAYNFEQINCAGEVRVHKDAADFELWAMDIMVKFREGEPLQQLDAHRQSGGERAVSTIFYLMALQALAQAPFRVVDEINQGMDPRNERMVHRRMVDIACGRRSCSQYFLITPKLLRGLAYDPKMRVLCIASGRHMPRAGEKMDFRRCLEVQKSLMAGAARG